MPVQPLPPFVGVGHFWVPGFSKKSELGGTLRSTPPPPLLYCYCMCAVMLLVQRCLAAALRMCLWCIVPQCTSPAQSMCGPDCRHSGCMEAVLWSCRGLCPVPRVLHNVVHSDRTIAALSLRKSYLLPDEGNALYPVTPRSGDMTAAPSKIRSPPRASTF